MQKIRDIIRHNGMYYDYGINKSLFNFILFNDVSCFNFKDRIKSILKLIKEYKFKYIKNIYKNRVFLINYLKKYICYKLLSKEDKKKFYCKQY